MGFHEEACTWADAGLNKRSDYTCQLRAIEGSS